MGLLVQVSAEDALAPLVAGQGQLAATVAWLLAAAPAADVHVLCPAVLVERVRAACPGLPKAQVVGLAESMALGLLAKGVSVRQWDGQDEQVLSTQALGASAPPARIVEKPWGREIWWAETSRYLGKLIEVRSGHSLSLQYHRTKLETLWVVAGHGRFQIGDQEAAAAPGYVVTLPPGTVHRIRADDDLQVIEVSSPEADDVVRLADRYGRT